MELEREASNPHLVPVLPYAYNRHIIWRALVIVKYNTNNSLQMVDCSHEIRRHFSLEEKLWQTQIAYYKAEVSLWQQRSIRQRYGFTSNQVQLWESDHEEGWAPKNWCFQTVVLEKTLENPLDNKEIKPVNPKGSQRRLFIGRTDAEPEAPILWPPDMKSQLVGRNPDTGKDWRQKTGMQKMRWLDSNTYSVDMNLSKLWEIVEDRGAWWTIVHGVTKELDTS